jgi:calcineurin-like phosphoesterase family protein
MSKNIFFISDTHFDHANFLNFEDDNRKKIRPFISVEEMNEFMIQQWNSVVKDGDKVYHLGDVGMNEKNLKTIFGRLKGSKRLCIGNHDLLTKKSPHFEIFKRITLWRLFKTEGFICTHVPLKKSQMRHALVNVHGHIHNRKLNSPIYFNACVEHSNYTPISIDEIKQHVDYVRTLDWENLKDTDVRDQFANV